MPTSTRFDQRAVALIELRGTQTECDMLEASLRDHDWPILEKRGSNATLATERRHWYVIEVRFPGSRFRAVSGARGRVELLADDLLLDLRVEAVDLVERDPADRPTWYVYDRPPTQSHTVDMRRTDRWRMRLALWMATTVGLRDTGRQITADTESAARNLAARPLPGVERPSADFSVRGSMGARHRHAASRNRPGRRTTNRYLAWLLFPSILSIVAGARIADSWSHGIGTWWPLSIFVLAAACVIRAALIRAFPEETPWAPTVFACLFTTFTVGIGAHAAITAPDRPFGSQALSVAALGYAVFTGVRLLARQLSWRRALPWLLPALLPIGLGFFPGIGLALQAAYLDGFGLNVEDIDVPVAWQMLASLKMIAAMSLWLVIIALWGYVKHIHMLLHDRRIGHVVLGALVVFTFGMGTWNLAVLPAFQAGNDAVAEAAKGRTPAPFFGIDPEWVCIKAVGAMDDIPVRGGRLTPDHSYLLIGDADGTAALWDAGRRTALKAPLDKLRILPAGKWRSACA